MQMGVALLPRRCAESEIARGELVALAMPEIRLRRQVRLVFRKGGERSHAATAFLALDGRREAQTEGTETEPKQRRPASTSTAQNPLTYGSRAAAASTSS